jgi:hypothetical protein
LKASLLSNIKKTFHLAWQSKGFFLLAMFFDLAFFVVFFLVFATIQIRVMEHLYVMVNLVQTDISHLSSTIASNAWQLLVKQPEFAYHLAEVIRYVMILMVVMYFIWGIFQGLVWTCCSKITDRRWKPAMVYIVKFFLVSLLWISVFYSFVYTWVKLSVYATFGMFPAVAQDFVTGLFISSTLLLCYFALISYPLLEKTKITRILQRTLLLGIAEYKRFVPMFVVALLLIAALGGMYYFIAGTNPYIFLLVSIFITLPTLTLIRVFATVTS